MGISLVLALAIAAGTPADVQSRGASLLRLDVVGDVRAVPDARASDVRVRATSGRGPVPFQLRVSRSGSQLTLRISGPRPAMFPFSGPSGAAYVVTYPARMRLELREHAGNAEIVAPVSETAVQCNAGNVAIARAHANVDVAVDAGNADVELARDFRGTSVRMQADSGNLTLHAPPAFRGVFDATAGTGQVSNPLASVRGGIPVFLFARTGNVKVVTP